MRFPFPSGPILNYEKSTKFAHNALLQILVETGLVGLTLFAIMMWNILTSINVRDASNWPQRGATAVVILSIVFSMFGFSFYLPFIGLLVAGCCGYLLEDNRPLEITDQAFHAYFRPVLFGVSILSCLFLFLAGFSEVLMAREKAIPATRLMPIDANVWYQRALNEPDPSERTRLLKKALSWNPQDPFIWVRLGGVTSSLRSATKEEVQAYFDRAERISPMHAPFWVENGLALARKNDLPGAKEKFKRAIHLEPQSALPYFALGMTLLRDNKKANAIALLRKAVQLQITKYPAIPNPKSAYTNYLYSVDITTTQRVIENLIIRHPQ